MTRILLAAGVLLLGAASLATPAHAYWRGGVWVGIGGPPFYYAPPPVYVPPPVYYASPPVVYAPAPPPEYAPPEYAPAPVNDAAPPRGTVPYGSVCYAGVYTCAAAGPVGSTCSCPGIGAPSFGSIR